MVEGWELKDEARDGTACTWAPPYDTCVCVCVDIAIAKAYEVSPHSWAYFHAKNIGYLNIASVHWGQINNACGILGSVYTMDHEIGSWKMAFSHGLTWWSNIHGLICWKSIYKAFGHLIRCQLNVDQEEWPCTKSECVDLFNIYPTRVVLEKSRFDHSLVHSCLQLLFPQKVFH